MVFGLIRPSENELLEKHISILQKEVNDLKDRMRKKDLLIKEFEEFQIKIQTIVGCKNHDIIHEILKEAMNLYKKNDVGLIPNEYYTMERRENKNPDPWFVKYLGIDNEGRLAFIRYDKTENGNIFRNTFNIYDHNEIRKFFKNIHHIE